MIRIESIVVSGWPALTWVALVPAANGRVTVLHGRLVEIREDWAIEGVWAGEFVDGGFDQTSLVFGSGVRCRGGAVVFVSSGSTLDRLFYCWEDDTLVVANSLPALMASTGRSLLDSCTDYPMRLINRVRDPDSPAPNVPSDGGPVYFAYLHNLIYENGDIRQVRKPLDEPVLDSFEMYRDFLFGSARAIGANAASRSRQSRITPITTVTRGYDSVAAAVVSREAGCTQAVTIRNARALIPRSDSGAHIARHLGLRCRVYRRGGGRAHPRELTFWAALGSTQDANLAVFEYPKPCCLLFAGVHGGFVWSLEQHVAVPNLERGTDACGLGFSEFRLWEGVVHCPVPFWGARQGANIWKLSTSSDMARWRIGGHYDRPIPRRLAEEAGVPRLAFGTRKSATQFEDSFLWPYGKDLSRSYDTYLNDRGLTRPRSVPGFRVLNWIDRNLMLPAEDRLRREHVVPLRAFLGRSHHWLFQWSNHLLRDALRAAIPVNVKVQGSRR